MIEQQSVNVYSESETNRINMSRWDITRKIEYNITHKFSYDFLLKYGYSRFLNNPKYIPGDWKNYSPDQVGELFLDIYRNEYAEDFKRIYADFKKYFEENKKEGWIPKELYQSFLKA